MATFLAVGAGAVGTGALDNIRLQGSDTLFEITKNVLANCLGADPAPGDQVLPPVPWDMNGLYYDGTGSGNGEKQMKTSIQTVAPMSRFLQTTNTCGATLPAGPDTAEGIVFALDGLSVVTSKANGDSCNGAVTDCDRTTEPTAGLAYSKTITLTDMSTYTFTSWRDVLRVLFAGMDHNGGNSFANRNCNSILRQSVANNWGNLFEAPCATCTQVEHAFRRDDASGTTDVFVALLGLPAITNGNAGSVNTPFCNAALLSDPLPMFVNRLPPDFQDNDPIRRPCTGTNNSVGSPGAPPANVATKQVCAAKRSLGLVQPIYATDFLSPAESFPNTPCAAGSFIFGAVAKQVNATGTGLTSVGARCPNGDIQVLGGSCLIPTTASGDPRCLAAFNTKPAFIFDNTPVDGQVPSGADGRVYNLHLRQANGLYQNDRRQPLARPIEGAAYRIHSTRTMSGPDFTINTCNIADETSQIGCLVHASPCSVGFAGRAATTEPNTIGLKVNAVSDDTTCIRSFAYPLSRKLYLNSMIGFENVTGQELALAQCYTGSGLTAPATLSGLITSNGFITLGTAPYCEDFNKEMISSGGCSTAAGTNTNACSNNVAPIPTASTTCGNAVVEQFEECDEGAALNGTAGHCTTACRNP
jgi:ABC-type phosphate transport system substrate-binding protein